MRRGFPQAVRASQIFAFGGTEAAGAGETRAASPARTSKRTIFAEAGATGPVGRLATVGTALNHELPEPVTAPKPKGRSVSAMTTRPATASSIGDMVGGGGAAQVAATGARVGRFHKARGMMNPGVDGHGDVSGATAADGRAGRPVPRRAGDSVAAVLQAEAALASGRSASGSSDSDMGRGGTPARSRRHIVPDYGKSSLVIG